MKSITLAALLALSVLPCHIEAEDQKFPTALPVFSVAIPDAWTPKEEGDWLECHSDDEKGSFYFQAAGSKAEFEKIVEKFILWLEKENEVDVKTDSQLPGEVKMGEREWKTISYDAQSKKYGSAKVGIMMTPLESGKALVLSFWITKQGSEKCMKTLEEKILPSVKAIK